MLPSGNSLPEQSCVKCTARGIYFSADPRKAVYCLECFTKMIKHKFAYSLGTNRIYKDGKSKETIVMYTGDANSALLLSLVKQGMDQDSHRRLQIVPMIVSIFDELDEGKLHLLHQKALNFTEIFPWPWHFFHVSAILGPISTLPENSSISGTENIPLYKNLLASVASNSARNELKRLLFDLLLWRIAKLCQVDKVMVSENVESLSNISFNALCFGRGSSLSDLTSVIDKREPEVAFIRPMREIYDKEVHFLNENEGSSQYILKSTSQNPIIFDDKPVYNGINHRATGIQTLTSDFLSSLQTGGFPATMTTILSVSQKVVPLNKDQDHKCLFCRIRNSPEKEKILAEPKCCLPCNNIFKEIKSDDDLALLLKIIRN